MTFVTTVQNFYALSPQNPRFATVMYDLLLNMSSPFQIFLTLYKPVGVFFPLGSRIQTKYVCPSQYSEEYRGCLLDDFLLTHWVQRLKQTSCMTRR
ncbi:hypothetical protein AVEN_174732-1 [Araneus ventricosus]|uniref:Uncharacterized protein n=1 Tax=Araneus ventricosus TaxID=182803 RepID=A0A4Y2BM27_ARAVE|nr:hypothetical protein AVEN_174732-1 [Araneus ventricosus]